MKKAAPYTLLSLMASATTVFKHHMDQKEASSNTAKKPGLDRRIDRIEYTAHAKCRMQCRSISQEEVEEILQLGKINYRKTDLKDRPCPSYALEGITRDKQRVRIVFAQCNQKTKVVTAIDLGKEWECHCPGEERKYQNKNQ